MSELEKEIFKVARQAVRGGRKKSSGKAVANVNSKNKRFYFNLPAGTITEQGPREFQNIAGTVG